MIKQVHVVNQAEASLNINEYDNQAINVAVISGFNIAGAAIPAGVSKVLISYYNHNTTAFQSAYIRWGAAANTVSCMRIANGDKYILEVPSSGTRQLNVLGESGVTSGTAINVVPLG